MKPDADGESLRAAHCRSVPASANPGRVGWQFIPTQLAHARSYITALLILFTAPLFQVLIYLRIAM